LVYRGRAGPLRCVVAEWIGKFVGAKTDPACPVIISFSLLSPI